MIKQLRSERNLTQQQFADVIGVPIRNIRAWEQGQRTPPEWVLNLIIYKLNSLTKGKQIEIELPTKQPKYVYCFIKEDHEIPLRMRIFTNKETYINPYEEGNEYWNNLSKNHLKEGAKIYRYTLSNEKIIEP